MPDPARLLRTLEQAVHHFQDTPGRRGRLVHLQDADEVFVVGDLHGNIENFRSVLAKAQLGMQPRRHLVLQELVHGPYRYPSGGDKSHQLIDLLAALKCQYPQRVHMLLGNHELSQWTDQAIAKLEDDLLGLFRVGLDSAYGSAAPSVYAIYCKLFAALPLAIRTANRVFLSHSLPSGRRLETFDPAVLEGDEAAADELRPGGGIHALVWGRDSRLETAEGFLNKVDADWLITGHIPCEKGFELANERQIILDALGNLAGYCLFPANRPVTQQDLLDGIGLL